MVMGIGQVMGIVAVVMIGFTLIVFVGAIAGKDILMAFRRKFNPRGCEVHIVNTNRNISTHYKTPKDNMFRINDLPYVVNPDKAMGLTEKEKMMVMDSIARTEQSWQARIAEVENKIAIIEGIAETKGLKEQIRAANLQEIERLKKIKGEFEKKLIAREQNYYKDKRPAFFFIEGDPVPKDFYEFYSMLDCKMIDNIITGQISKPPMPQELKDLSNIKWIVIIVG
jgi:hypothetical protein